MTLTKLSPDILKLQGFHNKMTRGEELTDDEIDEARAIVKIREVRREMKNFIVLRTRYRLGRIVQRLTI